MSYGASIHSHVYNPPITAEVPCGISRGQGWRPGTIVNSAPSQLEIETQLVMDRLLRECFTRKIAARAQAELTPLTPTHAHAPRGREKNSTAFSDHAITQYGTSNPEGFFPYS